MGLATPKPVEHPDEWPHNWGTFHWVAIAAPLAVLCSTLCGLYVRSRAESKRRRRVHVTEDPLQSVCGEQASRWDFTQAGPLVPEQIAQAEQVLSEGERAAVIAGRQPPRRRLIFGAQQNDLRKSHLANLVGLLDRHPAVTLQLDMDWRSANDSALELLVRLLRRKGRCQVRGSGKKGSANKLRLPLRGSPPMLGDVAEAIAFAGHVEVDSISVETSEASTSGGAVPPINVDLGPLRLSPQELVLSRQQLGDLGVAAACGFVRPWAGRLVAARLMECNIGDAGAAEISRLLLGRPEQASNPSVAGAAPSLRELVLSANRIGDRGAARLAEALPKCDALERLLIDRNLIGRVGAEALAKRLPRSSIRELVLGSHLGGNPLGAFGAEALASAFKDELERAAADRANRLEAVNLEGCGIGERGAKALAAALPTSAISVLSLAADCLGDAGATLILEALPLGFLSLDLAGNGISDAVASVVGPALQRMPSMSISLAQNELSMGLKAMLREDFGQRLRV